MPGGSEPGTSSVGGELFSRAQVAARGRIRGGVPYRSNEHTGDAGGHEAGERAAQHGAQAKTRQIGLAHP